MAVIKVSVEGVAVFVARGLGRLTRLLRPAAFVDFLANSAGVATELDALPSGLVNRLNDATAAAAALDAAANAVEAAGDGGLVAGIELIAKIGATLDALDGVRSSLNTIPNLDGYSAGKLAELSAEFTAYTIRFAVLDYLNTKLPHFVQLLALLGIVDQTKVNGPNGKYRFERTEFHLQRLSELVSDPKAHFVAHTGWGVPFSFEPGNAVFDRLELYLRKSGFVPERVLDGGVLTLDSPKGVFRALPGDDTALLYDFLFDIEAGLDLNGEIKSGASVSLKTDGGFPAGTQIELRPPLSLTVVPTSGSFASSLSVGITLTPTGAPAFRLIGLTGGTFVEAAAISFPFELTAKGNVPAEPSIGISFQGAKTVIALGGADGFVSSLFPGGKLEVSFDFSASFRFSSGLQLEAGALEVNLPLHLSFAGIELKGLRVALPLGADRPGLPLDFSTSLRATFGPFDMTVDRVGLATNLIFDGPNLRFGVADFSADILAPTGIGVSIDGGGISGGGFLTHDPTTGRYAGALELKVFVVSVKAFGILDTRFPDGTEGVSFVVVIIAEFTPIQLGFGFTLVGIGGLLAVNRTVDERALGDAVRTGSLENLLFPRNPVQDAPTIINDLASVFPAARGHQVFGPMAKLGWGTPTLVSADLGIILEFPGPRIALLGVLRMQLPKPDFALVNLQMAVAGLFDFPAGKMEIDAGLFDSTVAGYVVSGDMAYRLQTGNSSAFLLSVGGYNTAFQAPTQFPKLRRASVDLGVNGNPSLTASGYFAITSNTVQFGGAIDLRAHGFGIHLSGHLGVDVLFQFSPLHFNASFSASVHVDFHGFGLGVSLHGSISGPSPWHIDAKACVSVAFWDACLPVRVTFGNDTPAALPELDPWEGTPLEQRVDPRNRRDRSRRGSG